MKNRLRVLFCNKSTKQTEIIRVIYLYRYLSLIITSSFYLIGLPHSSIIYKLCVIFLLFIAATVVTKLYVNYSSKSVLRALIIIETVGITIILIPTGGLSSPFIWYALNPVLVAASFLKSYYCWANLTFYMIVSTLTTFYLNLNDMCFSVIQLVSDNLYMFLVLVLITLAVQLLSKTTKQLYSKQKELAQTNSILEVAIKGTRDSLEHIMSLYEVAEAVSSEQNDNGIYKVFAEYTAKLIKAEVAFFYKIDSKVDIGLVISNKDNDFFEYQLLKDLNNELSILSSSYSIFHVLLNGEKYILSKVSTSYCNYGFLGIKSNNELRDYNSKLSYLTRLCSVILDRKYVKEISDHLLLVEEQNRIANEIHDSVSQRLFSNSCAIHTLISKWDKIDKKDIKQQLLLIKDSSNTAMKELRSYIYGLSSKKKNSNSYYSTLKSYINNFAKLNDVTVEFDFSGDENQVVLSLQKILYRIICELCGNAVRHGGCNKIIITIRVRINNISLYVEDNGDGFDLEQIKNTKKCGLGLHNIESIVSSYNGSFDIKSNTNKGTKISVILPIEESKRHMGA